LFLAKTFFLIGQRKFKIDWEQIGDIYGGIFSWNTRWLHHNVYSIILRCLEINSKCFVYEHRCKVWSNSAIMLFLERELPLTLTQNYRCMADDPMLSSYFRIKRILMHILWKKNPKTFKIQWSWPDSILNLFFSVCVFHVVA
jgi:hypothetical protein